MYMLRVYVCVQHTSGRRALKGERAFAATNTAKAVLFIQTALCPIAWGDVHTIVNQDT